MLNYALTDETFLLRGIMFAVHKELGCGFLERVYQEALEYEFKVSGVPYEREKRLPICYKGYQLSIDYVADFVCYDKIIIELKAVSELTNIHRAQVMNYIKATDLDLALLVNFGQQSLQVERIFNYRKQKNQTNQINP